MYTENKENISRAEVIGTYCQTVAPYRKYRPIFNETFQKPLRNGNDLLLLNVGSETVL
jgi:hypothetical protein